MKSLRYFEIPFSLVFILYKKNNNIDVSIFLATLWKMILSLSSYFKDQNARW